MLEMYVKTFGSWFCEINYTDKMIYRIHTENSQSLTIKTYVHEYYLIQKKSLSWLKIFITNVAIPLGAKDSLQ